MKEKRVLQAVLKGKCPRCRQGDIFSHSTVNLKKFGKMHDSCQVCQLKFEVEPGFYFGSMYVSYAFSVGIFLVTGFSVYHLGDNPSAIVYILATALASILLYPFNLRYSRLILLYVFGGVQYDPNFTKKN